MTIEMSLIESETKAKKEDNLKKYFAIFFVSFVGLSILIPGCMELKQLKDFCEERNKYYQQKFVSDHF